MILPGLISVVFYRKAPTATQVTLGLVFTILISGLLGYAQDYGTSRVWENTLIAIVGGVILYGVILAFLVYYYFPRHAVTRVQPNLPPSAPPP
jgi:hypothetical protein